MENPVPVISLDKSVLEDCPVTKNIMSSSENMQDAEVSELQISYYKN